MEEELRKSISTRYDVNVEGQGIPSITSEANARLAALSPELRDAGVKNSTLAKLLSQDTTLQNRNRSYNRVNTRLIDPDANKFRTREMLGD